MSEPKKCDSETSSPNENDRYKTKCKVLRKIIRENVYENAAVCDEIAETQQQLLVVQEECKFLLKKLKSFEPKFDIMEAQHSKPIPVKKITSRKKAEKKSEKKNFITNDKKNTAKRQLPKHKQKLEQNVHEPIISGNVTIYNFGQIVSDTPFFYSDNAIYPAGYYATRTYAHFRNLFSICTYHCKVIKAGSSPRFEIMDNDKHFKVTGLSTDECHSHLISLINKMLGTDDLIPANGNGDRFFGLSIPTVRLKLQSKPESKLCTGYIPLKSQPDCQEAESKTENDPSVSFEGLHAFLNRFHSSL